MLSVWDYSQTKRKLFDSGSNLDRCGRWEHRAVYWLARKAPGVPDAANRNRPPIQTYRWDVVKRQAGIHQRHSELQGVLPSRSSTCTKQLKPTGVWRALEMRRFHARIDDCSLRSQ